MICFVERRTFIALSEKNNLSSISFTHATVPYDVSCYNCAWNYIYQSEIWIIMIRAADSEGNGVEKVFTDYAQTRCQTWIIKIADASSHQIEPNATFVHQS